MILLDYITDITGRHVEGKRLDKTVWNLLNFYAFVKYHVKSTRGFIQRRMRTRLESLVEVLYNAGIKDEHHIKKKNRGIYQSEAMFLTDTLKCSGKLEKDSGAMKFQLHVSIPEGDIS
nr:actin-related protein 2/3 complex subunit 2B-like isoform X2 [Coffea arabica]